MSDARVRGGTRDQLVRSAEHDRPSDRGEEAVRVRHVVEIERTGLREAGNDAHLLDAEQDERSPEHIEELHGDEEHPEGNGAIGAFGDEGGAVVAYEHGSPRVAELPGPRWNDAESGRAT